MRRNISILRHLMTYNETINYLYNVAPLFQNVGGTAYKEGLANSLALDQRLGVPHRRYATIHVAGTNGKGSTAHTLAAILQAEGRRVGLYTSPHLLDFRERIRVDGVPVPESYVVDFIAAHRAFFEPLYPSFFEITTAMAFAFFAEAGVDVAVVEVGMGGRLDCTNIITPALSVITNIAFDHTQFLGDTLEKIAREKAGIIKAGIPVVIGEALPETRPVFERRARDCGAPIFFAANEQPLLPGASRVAYDGTWIYATADYGEINGSLRGRYQLPNAETVLTALRHLPWRMSREAVAMGFGQVERLTGLRGRWEVLQHAPDVVCDTGHNADGWEFISAQLSEIIAHGKKLHVVFGICADKDVAQVLGSLPREATYYLCTAAVRRGMAASELLSLTCACGLRAQAFPSVALAVATALAAAESEDMVFIGGSSFVVAEALPLFPATPERRGSGSAQ